MTTTPAQIDLWRQSATETQKLEFKEAKASYDRQKLAAYCVAIANEGGGHFLLGITDKPPRTVVGSAAFPNVVKTAEQLFDTVGFRVDVEEVSIQTAASWSSISRHGPAARLITLTASISCDPAPLSFPCLKTGCERSSPKENPIGWRSLP